jgi:hypothetical protein
MRVTPYGLGVFVTNPLATAHVMAATGTGLNGYLVSNPVHGASSYGSFFGVDAYDTIGSPVTSGDDAVIWNYQAAPIRSG